MLTLLVILGSAFLLGGLLKLGFLLTGAMLSAAFWLLLRLPLALLILALGAALCCTLFLLPIGLRVIRGGLRVLLPGLFRLA